MCDRLFVQVALQFLEQGVELGGLDDRPWNDVELACMEA